MVVHQARDEHDGGRTGTRVYWVLVVVVNRRVEEHQPETLGPGRNGVEVGKQLVYIDDEQVAVPAGARYPVEREYVRI